MLNLPQAMVKTSERVAKDRTDLRGMRKQLCLCIQGSSSPTMQVVRMQIVLPMCPWVSHWAIFVTIEMMLLPVFPAAKTDSLFSQLRYPRLVVCSLVVKTGMPVTNTTSKMVLQCFSYC